MPYPLQWGAPTFDAGNAFAIMIAAFAALVEVSTPPDTTWFVVVDTTVT